MWPRELSKVCVRPPCRIPAVAQRTRHEPSAGGICAERQGGLGRHGAGHVVASGCAHQYQGGLCGGPVRACCPDGTVDRASECTRPFTRLPHTAHPALLLQRPESLLTQGGHVADTSAAHVSATSGTGAGQAAGQSAQVIKTADGGEQLPTTALRFEATREQLGALLEQMAAAEAAIAKLGGQAS